MRGALYLGETLTAFALLAFIAFCILLLPLILGGK